MSVGYFLLADGQEIITAFSQGHASQKSEGRLAMNIFWPPENDSFEEGQGRYTFDVNSALSPKANSFNESSVLVILKNADVSLPTDDDDEADGREDNVSTSPEASSTLLVSTLQGDIIRTNNSSTNISLYFDDNDDNDDTSEDSVKLETNTESAMSVPRTEAVVTSPPRMRNLNLGS
ncbi:hypothetical protein MRX96_002107 [Rhipicephalus microplus]